MKSTINYDDKTIENILLLYGFDNTSVTSVISSFEIIKVKKGSNFLKEGKKSDRIGILIDGLLFAYTINEKGEKNVSRFFYNPENPIVVNFKSLILNEPSDEIIECLEDSYLIVIKKGRLDELYTKLPAMNKIGRVIAEDSYIKALNKIKILQSNNSRERIITLQNQAPELFKKVQKNYIASYLGMHRNTFNKAFASI